MNIEFKKTFIVAVICILIILVLICFYCRGLSEGTKITESTEETVEPNTVTENKTEDALETESHIEYIETTSAYIEEPTEEPTEVVTTETTVETTEVEEVHPTIIEATEATRTTEPTEEAEPTEEIEPTEETYNVEEGTELISLGEFKLTAYCSCSKCCGKYALNRPVDENGNEIVYGSAGIRLIAGVSIAVDPSVIPYRTKVVINGHTYIAHDTGGSIKGNRIDVYFDDHQKARNFGVRYAEVYMVVS